jgi:hypothetical protein
MGARIFAYSLLAFLGSASAFAATPDCGRACLRDVLDRYMGAVLKHDPSSAPLFAGFRETDNAVAVKPGNGVWKTFTALGKIQRRYVDPVNQSAGYFGTIEEGSDAAVATLRLKVDRRKITEAEWVIGRKPPGGELNIDGLVAAPPPDHSVVKEARSSREAMIAAANSYFDGLQTHDGSVILAHPGCARIENGTNMTGRRMPVLGGKPGEFTVFGDCASNMEQMQIAATAARRFPVVDEDTGVLLGMVIFIRPPGSTIRRNLLTEWFVIENNKVRGIYAAMYYPPADVPLPNWPPYEGNWPLPSSFPAAAPPGGPPAPAPAKP